MYSALFGRVFRSIPRGLLRPSQSETRWPSESDNVATVASISTFFFTLDALFFNQIVSFLSSICNEILFLFK